MPQSAQAWHRTVTYRCNSTTAAWCRAWSRTGGPASHTGERTCFHRGDLELAPHEALPALERTIAARRAERPDGSYTSELLDDPARIAEKVREEADEVARAHADESPDRVAEEGADVLYHLLVLLRHRDVDMAAVERVLNGRRR